MRPRRLAGSFFSASTAGPPVRRKPALNPCLYAIYPAVSCARLRRRQAVNWAPAQIPSAARRAAA